MPPSFFRRVVWLSHQRGSVLRARTQKVASMKRAVPAYVLLAMILSVPSQKVGRAKIAFALE
jgi:hypothetical protein